MKLKRCDANPLLTPDNVAPTRGDLEVLCTLNPAAVRFGDEILLLVRVGEKAPDADDAVAVLQYDPQADDLNILYIKRDDPDLDSSDPRKYRYKGKTLLTSMSHLRLARSTDGVNFTFDQDPAIFPATPHETFGCEDARITFIDGVYYIAYTAVSKYGVAVALAWTEDFRKFTRGGLIFPPYQKDVCIFPEKIDGQYVCRHRPYRSEFNDACIWTAYSPDMFSWGRHEVTLCPQPGTWNAGRVGGGAPPIKTDHGWLEIYHAADAGGRYRLGAMLSELERPERIIALCDEPIFEPQTDYEIAGVYDNVVFSNGVIADPDGTLTVYYGAADRICAAATTTVQDVLDAVMA